MGQRKVNNKKLKFSKKRVFKLRRLGFFGAIFGLLATVMIVTTNAAIIQPCYSWNNQVTIQEAVDNYSCIDIQPGNYSVTKPTWITKAVTINGNGATITATGNWDMTVAGANNAIFRITTGSLVANSLTLDASNKVSYVVTPNSYNLNKVTMKNGACSAIGIGNTGVIVTNSIMDHNGFNCKPFSGLPLGAAIYAQNASSTSYYFSPVITGNTIINSNGPGMDINGVWGGTFKNNTVYGNTGWAAVSIYGGSYWTISGNNVSHASSNAVNEYHPYCQATKGPIGVRSAAIFMCQDSKISPFLTNFNVIENNSASGGYGILLVGADEVLPWMTPRLITVKGNSVLGSIIGCADDLKLKQWLDGNTWTNNNCQGLPNTSPIRF